MPWKQVSVMQSRLEFVREAEREVVSVAELCRRFGISRSTGFAYLRRHREQGAEGLQDCSRRPKASPRKSSAAIEAQVVALRQAHPRWGGRKLARRLRDMGVEGVPSASTVTEILRRHELIDPAEAAKHRAFQRFERTAPNELWQMDFKGHFALDRGRCHPLTVLDDHCRYSVGLFACGDERQETVQGHLTSLFRRYGLPEALLCDNGSPWGGGGETSYTALEVWLMRVGVRMLHGRPYHPQTQGKDERFHKSLDIEVLQAARYADLTSCQTAFDAWRRIYNDERPHEALRLAVPSSRYQPSARSYSELLAAPEYYTTDQVRRVAADGSIGFDGRRIRLSQGFAGLDVAVRQTSEDGVWHVYFSRFRVARVALQGNPRDTEPEVSTVRDVSEHPSSMSPV